MKDIIQKVSKPENLVLDACARTFSVPEACILFLKYRKFKGCGGDPRFETERMQQLILVYA